MESTYHINQFSAIFPKNRALSSLAVLGRVLMDVPDQVQEVLVIIHRFTLEQDLEQMLCPAVLPVAPLDKANADPFHGRTDVFIPPDQ